MKNNFNLDIPHEISALRRFSALATPKCINLGLGKPFEDMPNSLRTLASQVIKNKNLAMDYSDNAGIVSVRTLLEQRYELPSGSTILTHGAQEALFAALMAILNPGDEVLCPDPGFVAYETMAQVLHAKAKTYLLQRHQNGAFSYCLEQISKKVTKKTKVIILNAPGNPTASVVSKKFVKQLANQFPHITILSDEVYAELSFTQPYIPFAVAAKNIVSINAFSKSHALTGWRLGWLCAADRSLYNRILVAHQYVATCASVPAQHLLGAMLRHPTIFDSLKLQYRQAYLLRRDTFFNAFKTSVPKPEAGFFAFLPIPKTQSSSLGFAKKLLKEKNILVIPGEFFGKQGQRFVRVSYANSIEQLKLAGKKLATYY
jgi:aspartate/methionine/tyrosine aminotransferase